MSRSSTTLVAVETWMSPRRLGVRCFKVLTWEISDHDLGRDEIADAESIAAKRQTIPSHLRKAVANELDWICLKCLEKDRGRRYETAIALAQDLERYLAGQPVQAGPHTIAYRFKKFAKRIKSC